jgi:hypothetical protein
MSQSALLNDFAIRSFRDVADSDYIVARMSYRAGLISQFYWSSLQAIEKYLKAILLINRIPARNVNHDLSRAMKLTAKLPFTLLMHSRTRDLIRDLDRFGRFRYLESSFHIYGPRLTDLDRAAWEIRRYCKPLNYEATFFDGHKENVLDVELARIADSNNQSPQSFRLTGGHLEKILDTKQHPARPWLIWNNLFYGRRVRRKARMAQHSQMTNAPLWLHPEILDDVLQFAYLPKEVVAAYRIHARNALAGGQQKPAKEGNGVSKSKRKRNGG